MMSEIHPGTRLRQLVNARRGLMVPGAANALAALSLPGAAAPSGGTAPGRQLAATSSATTTAIRPLSPIRFADPRVIRFADPRPILFGDPTRIPYAGPSHFWGR